MAIDALAEGPPDPITGLPTYPNLDMALQPTGVRGVTTESGHPVRDVAGNPVLLNVEASVTLPDGSVVKVSDLAESNP